MKIRPILIATFAIVLLGAAVGGGTFLGHTLNASPPTSPRIVPQLQIAEGQFPLNFQGILLDDDGNPVSNSSHSLTFSIYDDEEETVSLWKETQTVFSLNGLFTVQLGIKEEIDPEIFANSPETWLGIRVEFDPELEPRIRMAYSPYAIHAITADNLVLPPPSPQQIATLRWYDANEIGIKVALDFEPTAIAFDGEHIWVANRGDEDETDDDALTKVRALDGKVVADFPVGDDPVAIVYDGENIWVANHDDNTLSKFRKDGSRSRVIPQSGDTIALTSPVALAFDGRSVWVVNEGSDKIVVYDVESERAIDSISVGDNPSAIAFDGTYMWVTHSGTKNVTRITASTGKVLDNFRAGEGQLAIAFDGTSMWIANEGDNSVTKVRASDGEELGTFLVGQRPVALAFDGAHIWVANRNSNSVTKLRASDGKEIGEYSVGRVPSGVAFDGANIWVVNKGDDNMVKR